MGFPSNSAVKNLPSGDARDLGLIPGQEDSPHGNLLKYSCLENPMDRGARLDAVYRVAKSWT